MDFACVWEVTNVLPPNERGEVYFYAKAPMTGEYLKRPVKASHAYYTRADEPIR